MIDITVEDKQVKELIKHSPRQATRAAEIALDRTAFEGRDAVKQSIPQVFDNPVPYTRNSVRVERTRNHNMKAAVLFKEPDRMGQHYLVPQVEGGRRKLKGFERALGGRVFYPSKHAKLNKYGNMPYGQIVQILSVLGRAEYMSGYSANITERSKKRNRKPRDFVLLRKRHGKLPPGVYQRKQTGVGFGAKTKRTMPFGVYQKGRRRGRFASVVRARGLVPVLIQGKRSISYRKQLPFYEIVGQVTARMFHRHFAAEFAKQLRRAR